MIPVKRLGRWYLQTPSGDLARWGHGSSWAANFRLKREAVAWAIREGLS